MISQAQTSQDSLETLTLTLQREIRTSLNSRFRFMKIQAGLITVIKGLNLHTDSKYFQNLTNKTPQTANINKFCQERKENHKESYTDNKSLQRVVGASMQKILELMDHSRM